MCPLDIYNGPSHVYCIKPEGRIHLYLWAWTRENQLSGFANNKGACQPAHPRSLTSAFVVRLMERNISRFAMSRYKVLVHFLQMNHLIRPTGQLCRHQGRRQDYPSVQRNTSATSVRNVSRVLPI